jgi:hypothetical protein
VSRLAGRFAIRPLVLGRIGNRTDNNDPDTGELADNSQVEAIEFIDTIGTP